MTGAIVGIALEAAADHGHVRIRTEAGGLHANTELGAVDPTSLAAQLNVEQRGHVADDRRMFRRTAGHRPHLAVEELVLDLGDLLQDEVLVEGKALASGETHVSEVYHPPHAAARGIRREASACEGCRSCRASVTGDQGSG